MNDLELVDPALERRLGGLMADLAFTALAFADCLEEQGRDAEATAMRHAAERVEAEQ